MRACVCVCVLWLCLCCIVYWPTKANKLLTGDIKSPWEVDTRIKETCQRSESAVGRQEYNEDVGPKDMLRQTSKAIVETKFCKL